MKAHSIPAALPLSVRSAACRLALALALLLAGSRPAAAQWLSQSLSLKSGWNAVYLHVDSSHDTLENLIASDLSNPILEIWMWAPAPSTLQFVQTPQAPVEGGQWMSWNRNAMETSLLRRLPGNVACLVRVSTGAAPYTWTVQGKPMPPDYEWTTSGLNFLGFPTAPSGAPTFENFLAKAPELQQSAEIYYYPGGELGAGNPARLYALRTTQVRRGQAFWIRSGTVYNRYFAPFETALSGSRGVSFGDSLNSSSFRLRNLTSTNLTVTLRLTGSEPPPPGQTNIVGAPSLIVRGDLNTTNLTYGSTNLPLNGVHTWTLAGKGLPGSEVEVVLGLDRAAMGGSVGDLFAGILRLTDSLGHAQVDLPVTASVASRAGLWVGAASVTQVGQYLKDYNRDANNNPVMDTNGQYVVTSLMTNLGAVPRPFPLRLIVHNPEVGAGNAVLLQRVFVGLDPWTNTIVALHESSLGPDFLNQARRISAAHLPWNATNQAWAFNGTLGQTSNLTASITLPFNDQASNPFLHTYHPDHDNLDTAFKNELAQGAESYTVRRVITLNVVPPSDGAASFATAAQVLSGQYSETITVQGLARAGGTFDTRTFHVTGFFSLNRVSSIPALTAP